jgi:hypothetical protein
MRGRNEGCVCALCTATFAKALYIPNAAELSLIAKNQSISGGNHNNRYTNRQGGLAATGAL